MALVLPLDVARLRFLDPAAAGPPLRPVRDILLPAEIQLPGQFPVLNAILGPPPAIASGTEIPFNFPRVLLPAVLPIPQEVNDQAEELQRQAFARFGELLFLLRRLLLPQDGELIETARRRILSDASVFIREMVKRDGGDAFYTELGTWLLLVDDLVAAFEELGSPDLTDEQRQVLSNIITVDLNFLYLQSIPQKRFALDVEALVVASMKA